jgi:pyruvate/2-oxoglutarate dehydrogenase complex dihydrolipoamide acyltransferase (E2) component
MVEVIIPRWGLTTEEYVFVAWHRFVGDEVHAGEPLGEIEADKVCGEVTSPATGVIEELLADVGDALEPGQVIARIRPLE